MQFGVLPHHSLCMRLQVLLPPVENAFEGSTELHNRELRVKRVLCRGHSESMEPYKNSPFPSLLP